MLISIEKPENVKTEPPPMNFPFLWRSEIYPGRVYLRYLSRSCSTRNSGSVDMRITEDYSASRPADVPCHADVTVTDAEAWKMRLAPTEVVRMSNEV